MAMITLPFVDFQFNLKSCYQSYKNLNQFIHSSNSGIRKLNLDIHSHFISYLSRLLRHLSHYHLNQFKFTLSIQIFLNSQFKDLLLPIPLTSIIQH